jgi:hypothetical protein
VAGSMPAAMARASYRSQPSTRPQDGSAREIPNEPQELRFNGRRAQGRALRSGGCAASCGLVEIFVIIIPPFIALLLGAWAVLAPKPMSVPAEQAQLAEHIIWLEQRLAHARAGNWDEQMMANLHAQLASALRRRELLAAA